MSKILELYNAQEKALGVDTIKVGASYNNLPGGYYSGDATPYSLGTGMAGKKDIDEAGLKAVEKLKAAGNRYQIGEFGGGSSYLKNGYTDAKPYGKTPRK